MKVMTVDDLLTSGDSTEGLRHALRQQGIDRTDVVTLASSNQVTSLADLDLLSKRVADGTGEREKGVKALVVAQLRQALRKLVKELLRRAEVPEHARAIYQRLAGKRTAIPGNGG